MNRATPKHKPSKHDNKGDYSVRGEAHRDKQAKAASHRAPASDEDITLGSILGSATGEGDRDVVPGGWSGTEDATSTAPSDLMGIALSPDGQNPVPDINKMGDDIGDISDLQETDTEEDGEKRKNPEVHRRDKRIAKAG
jgi:hypothetical protein